MKGELWPKQTQHILFFNQKSHPCFTFWAYGGSIYYTACSDGCHLRPWYDRPLLWLCCGCDRYHITRLNVAVQWRPRRGPQCAILMKIRLL